jgi:SAM-dependent methyltransferase
MDLSESYSQIAKEYAEKIFDELAYKPKDREILDLFSQLVGENAVVYDLGCGPGQISKYLKSKRLIPIGIDISSGMIEHASRLNPDLEFKLGNMTTLLFPNDSAAGITAFYSLIHISKKTLPLVFEEVKRVLAPGGIFLFSFHIGDETVHLALLRNYSK